MTAPEFQYDVEEHARYCGPRAFAAAVGGTAADAALELRAVGQRLGEDPDYAVSPRALATAISDTGMVLEDWSVLPGGWRRGTLDIGNIPTSAEIRDLIAGVTEINRAHNDRQLLLPSAAQVAIEQTRGIRSVRSKRRLMRALTVAQWLRRFPRRTWVLLVKGHVLAARGGEIIAGGNTYGDHELQAAWRAVRPYA